MDGREAELEPGYVMGWEFNNIMLGRGPESILEGVSDVRNSDGEVVSGIFRTGQGICEDNKSTFLSYFSNVPLIKLILLGTLRDRKKLKVPQVW